MSKKIRNSRNRQDNQIKGSDFSVPADLTKLNSKEHLYFGFVGNNEFKLERIKYIVQFKCFNNMTFYGNKTCVFEGPSFKNSFSYAYRIGLSGSFSVSQKTLEKLLRQKLITKHSTNV